MLRNVFTVMLLFACLTGSVSHAQQTGASPYPIIFVHGLSSNEDTWFSVINDGVNLDLQDVYGNYDPNLDVYHAVLNAYPFTTDVLVDVVVDFPNHTNNPSTNGSLFAINFETSLDANGNLRNSDPDNGSGQSDGNKSAIVKQGYALSQMIEAVLSATGADKVILVGHSMGGLAIREYLQRKVNGNHRWWDDTVGHRVAKAVTTGTPHVGSNLFEPLGVSEAVRDLRWDYSAIGPNFDGAYLFGGSENSLKQAIGTFDNFDVDCDGNENSTIVGINTVGTFTFNPGLALPSDIEYVWITSDPDAVVAIERMWLYDNSK